MKKIHKIGEIIGKNLGEVLYNTLLLVFIISVDSDFTEHHEHSLFIRRKF